VKQTVYFRLDYDKYDRVFVMDLAENDAERVGKALETELRDILPEEVGAEVWIG